MTKSSAPTLRTRPVATRALDGDDGPVRIKTPDSASACPTVGANCHRYVTADAMGMAKEGDKNKVNAAGAGCGIGDMHNDGHCDVPRFRALVRDKNPYSCLSDYKQ